LSPEISWSDTPPETKSFALIIDDPDLSPAGRERLKVDKFDHWVLFNIPPDCRKIEKGSGAGIVGVTTLGEAKYMGPCPPDREHRYFFKLYALDVMLDLNPGAKADELEQAMTGHILETAVLMARYERVKK
jgi:Raf kinase inhibitor-like YbhB/YbcL family protein